MEELTKSVIRNLCCTWLFLEGTFLIEAVLTSSCEGTGRVFSCSFPSLQATRKVGLCSYFSVLACSIWMLCRILYIAFDKICFRAMCNHEKIHVRYNNVMDVNKCVSYCILFVFSLETMLSCISRSWTEVIMQTMKL